MPSLSVAHRPDGVAVLTFDAPDSRANVLSEAVWNDLRSAVRTLRMRSGVAGLVLASAKPDVFVAGADLKFYAALKKPNSPAVHDLVRLGLSTLNLLEGLPFPTVAAVNGAALGGGLEVALACDLRVCGPNPATRLGLPEVTLGLIPGWGGTQRLPRVADVSVAVRMLLTGEPLSATDSLAAKLVDAVFPDGDLIEMAAQAVVGMNPEPFRRAKRDALPLLDQELLKEAVLECTPHPPGAVPSEPLSERAEYTPAVTELAAVLVRGGEQPLDEALRIESAAFARLAGSDESKRLIGEFFEKRKK